MADNGQRRADLKAGMEVDIVLKQDQRSGKRTRGIIQQFLTKSASHPHGIKVRLEDGSVGRVKEIISG
ncbi:MULTISPECIES: YwbE family protein [Salibacterium]|uniref:YwbE family protein n=1 Tax=Salibacterium lacus TaxID=1898109 RepID=A0ABW5T5A9_9BACI|nr:YwbE family protein [Salibacterium qingdaonense]